MSTEVSPPGSQSPVDGAASAPLRSVHTENLHKLIDGLGISLMVTTYQAGKLVIVRADGEKLNTHFRSFRSPMGIALLGGRLAMGTRNQICEFHNVPGAIGLLKPPEKHDACFLPRCTHTTGDIRVHEMAFATTGPNASFAQPELWVVNTRFSCLCTLDHDHSFVPHWRPPFVTAYAAEDRCHLNGLGMVDGRPRYVTALGRTDGPAQWRENKASGGVLMDITNNEVVCEGLSMPHSPRWYAGKLWVLESGEGALCVADPKTGKRDEVARMPGFTRGLDFVGPYAFIGLSQVRETATFSGIPIVDRLKERTCGVWAVDTRTGAVIGFWRFEDGVQEVFAVQVIPKIRYPDLLTESVDSEALGIISNAFVLPTDALKEVAPARPRPELVPEPVAT